MGLIFGQNLQLVRDGRRMTPEKRKKIKALLDNPASTPNEKEICRKLLKGNPEEPGRPVTGHEVRNRVSGWANPRSRESGIFWEDFLKREQGRQDAARRQAQAVNDGVNWYKNASDSARRQQRAAQDAEDRDRGIHRGQSRGGRVYPGAGPDLGKQRQEAWKALKNQMEAGNLIVDYGPIKDFYRELERLRKERCK